jgi:hypothetical protein
MNRVFEVISGIGILIGIYLFLKNGAQTASIIQSIAQNANEGIKTLQGRD